LPSTQVPYVPGVPTCTAFLVGVPEFVLDSVSVLDASRCQQLLLLSRNDNVHDSTLFRGFAKFLTCACRNSASTCPPGGTMGQSLVSPKLLHCLLSDQCPIWTRTSLTDAPLLLSTWTTAYHGLPTMLELGVSGNSVSEVAHADTRSACSRLRSALSRRRSRTRSRIWIIATERAVNTAAVVARAPTAVQPQAHGSMLVVTVPSITIRQRAVQAATPEHCR
jgi:hypothetical protein